MEILIQKYLVIKKVSNSLTVMGLNLAILMERHLLIKKDLYLG